jgi:two-component system LytT family response regulator
MPELTGFEVLKSLPHEAVPLFVFVTAFNDYALDAFAVDALDYLLKPFDAERLRVSVRRARERMHARADESKLLSTLQQMSETQREIRAAISLHAPATAQPVRAQYLDRVAVKADGRVFFVRVGDIDYIESAGNYVKLHVGNDAYLIREKVGDLAAKLNPSSFVRIHRSTIVNLDKVKEIQPWFSGDALVILRGGQKLRLSRGFRGALDLGTRSRL